MTQKADTVFTLANSKEKPLSPYNVGGSRKLNSRQLKCSLESLSIPPAPTNTHPQGENLTVTVYSPITVNCSVGNLAGLRTLPFPSPHESPSSPSPHQASSPSLFVTSCWYICMGSRHTDCDVAQRQVITKPGRFVGPHGDPGLLGQLI